MTEPLKKLMVAAFIILGTLLRLFFINRTFQYDEAFTYYSYVETNPFLALSNYSYPNNHIFHTLLVQISTFFFGDSLLAIRLPAFLAGIAILPLSFIFVKKLLNEYVAIVALAYFAVSPVLIEFASNARGYSIVCCCFLILLIFVLKQIRSKKDLLMMITISIIGVHTIPIFLYPFSVVILWLILINGKSAFKEAVFICIGTIIGCLIAYTPVLFYSGTKALLNNNFIQAEPLSLFFNKLMSQINSLANWFSFGYSPVFFALILFGIVYIVIKPRKKLIYLTISSLLAIIAILFITQKTPPDRVWQFTLFITVPLGLNFLQYVPKPKFSTFSFATLIVLFGLVKNPTFVVNRNTTPDYEIISKELKKIILPGDEIIAKLPIDYPLEYYLQKKEIPFSFEHVHNGGYPSAKSYNRRFVIFHADYHSSPKELISNSRNGFKYLKSIGKVHLYRILPSTERN